jgi:hypothetical protein
MYQAVVPSKKLTFGEGGSALAFAAGAVLCVVIAINAYPDFQDCSGGLI